ncbi:hypothetical protein J7E52_02200 [Bacillus sp. ISL-34]|uniref:hypothetical protein n=1 Tax=Bacillus sp. ISL-34 TaxID=2819121 RepID=UPI001BE9F773|nr:hypothetical protein [Bacillus sp. ISL-34]MBT2645542.1 hypothetical protein [Bacillus sp. ISL-34]
MKEYRHKMGMACFDDMYIYFNCNILTDDRKLNTSKGEPKRLRVNGFSSDLLKPDGWHWCRDVVLDTSNTGRQWRPGAFGLHQCITEKSH